MTKQQIIKILKKYNEWRRGKGIEIPYSTEKIGEAIDKAIESLKQQPIQVKELIDKYENIANDESGKNYVPAEIIADELKALNIDSEWNNKWHSIQFTRWVLKHADTHTTKDGFLTWITPNGEEIDTNELYEMYEEEGLPEPPIKE